MPRNRTRTKPNPPYSVKDIQNAVAAVQGADGGLKMTYRQAEAEFHVPISVIYQRIGGRKTSLDRQGAGRPTALSRAVEDTLENCLIARATFGFPCDRKELFKLVAEYCSVNNIRTQFKNGIPGEDWYLAFMKRHPRLSLKIAEHLQKCRKDATHPDIVYDFYRQLKAAFEKASLTTPEKASFVFNSDESGFNSDPARVRGIGERGVALSRVSGGCGRESTTVLAAISADGTALPPLIIFKGATVQARWTSEHAFPGTVYGASRNGWMEEPHFYNWFSTVLIPHIKKVRIELNKPEQAAFLLYDGHSSHVSVRIIEAAMENNIEIMRLPSHTTDKLQPLDTCVFGPIKKMWNQVLVEYGRTQMGKGVGRLPKNIFVEKLSLVWAEKMGPRNIISGFRSTGIFPLDEKKFSESMFNPIDLQIYRDKIMNGATEALTSNSEGPPVSVASTPLNAAVPIASTSSKPPVSVPSTLLIAPMPIPSTSCSNSPSTLVNAPLPFPSTSKKPSASVLLTPGIMVPTPARLVASKKRKKSEPSPQQIQERQKIIDIFAKTIADANTKPVVSEVVAKRTPVPRLKQMKYGEILTNEETLARLRDAEAEKALKESKKGTSRKLRKQSKHARIEEKSEVDKHEEIVLSQGRSDDIDLEEDLTLEEVEMETPTDGNIQPGVYVLVDFLVGQRKKTHYKYICCVQHYDAQDGEVTVTELSISGNSGINFIESERLPYTVPVADVLGILPNPTRMYGNRKTVFTFPGKVPVFEKQ